MEIITSIMIFLRITVPTVANPLLGSWRLDRDATREYLRTNNVMPEHLIEKLFKAQISIEWSFDDTCVYGGAHEKGASMPYRITLHHKNKLVMVAKDKTTGKEVKSTITLDDNGQGYWQETDLVEGYRERVIRLK